MPQMTKELCKNIVGIDKGIRFAGMADRMGKLVAFAYRQGLQPLLTKEESELSVMQSLLRMGMRKTMEDRLGRTVYAFALYEKVKRATLPLDDGAILLLSFDIEANHEPIILLKILPLLKS
ncbi:MAG: hypothetical protein ACREAO_01540 [Nitrososphaera sp.]